MSFYKKVPGRVQTLESALLLDTKPTKGSTNPVTSEGVADGIADATNDLLFKESAGVRAFSSEDEYVVGHFYSDDSHPGMLGYCFTNQDTPDGDGKVRLAFMSIAEALNTIVDELGGN